jgi:hypothetical protein
MLIMCTYELYGMTDCDGEATFILFKPKWNHLFGII